MKQLFFAGIAVAWAAAAFAGTLTGNGGQGTSIVDAGGSGDYLSLAAAASDFSQYSGGLTGDWTLLIRTNLDEPNHVAFGNKTNGFKVTVRPHIGTQPIIKFTTSTLENSGTWRGHWQIGTTSPLNLADSMTSTDLFIIDGSNTVGGSTRDLTITNTTQTLASMLVRVVGACDGVHIKNCIMDNLSTGTGTGTEAICIEYTSRRVGGINYHPKNGRVENCLLRSMVSDNGQTVVCRNSGTLNPGDAQTGLVMTGNECYSTFRTAFVGLNSDVSFTSNTISCLGSPTSNTGNRPESLLHNSSNLVSGWTFEVANNRWIQLKNLKTTNPTGVNFAFNSGVAGNATTVVSGTYNIINNFVGGMDYSGVTIADGNNTNALFRAFVQSGSASAVVMNFYHNSINMGHFPGITGSDTQGRFGPFSITGATTNTVTANIRNNNVRFEQAQANMIYAPAGFGGTVNSDHNNWQIGTSGAKMALYAGTTYNTLSAWVSAGRGDSNSSQVNPTLPSGAGGKWVSDNDLHFDAKPADAFAAYPIAGITMDIDGQTRGAISVYKGADERAEELSLTNAAKDWTLLE